MVPVFPKLRRATARLVSVLAVMLIATGIASADAVNDLAAAHYPEYLDADYEYLTADGTPPIRRWVAESADLDGTGSADYVVAVYTNSISGAVRVLRNGAVVAQSNYPAMGGIFPRLRVAELTGDGKPEIVASFAAMHGEQTWILQRRGEELVSVGPTTMVGEVVNSALNDADFFDIDGDGVMELLVLTEDEGGAKDVVYKLGSGGFSQTGTTLLHANRYVRIEAEPEIFTAVFPASAGQKVLIKLVNGDRSGGQQATSGELWLNGKQLLGHNDFKKKTRTISVQAVADALNEIEVDLMGKPGTEVTVTVTPVQ